MLHICILVICISEWSITYFRSMRRDEGICHYEIDHDADQLLCTINLIS